jgi:O-antigen biosynthesis protein
VYSWILSEDRPPALRAPTNGPLRINWVLPEIVRGSGGLFNIFRTVLEFEKMGHQNRVYIVSTSPNVLNEAADIARKDYFPISSSLDIFSANDIADSDAIIATSWETAYRVRSVSNTARKFYFVQDLEHLFFAEGSLSEFARQTYQWGFYGLTAGQWIADVLRKDFQMESSPFGFSYDRKHYLTKDEFPRRTRQRRVLFYARPRTERRGYELGILALTLVAKRLPEVQLVLVGVPMGSVQLPFAAEIHGVLEVSQLGDLYRSCDVALILSHTNASLLPLELMACGCAVVSNSGPNVEWLIDHKVACLAQPTPAALSEAIVELLTNDHLRDNLAESALAFVEKTDWATEAKAVERGIYNGLGITG